MSNWTVELLEVTLTEAGDTVYAFNVSGVTVTIERTYDDGHAIDEVCTSDGEEPEGYVLDQIDTAINEYEADAHFTEPDYDYEISHRHRMADLSSER